MKHWIKAMRLRTLPLTLACIGMGGILAYREGIFKGTIFLLTIFTAAALQILSNLANDYGDTVNGADHAGRQGPQRAVQSGVISTHQMKNAMRISGLLSFSLGIALLYFANLELKVLLSFLLLGLLSIWAAIAYTNGKRPYGYEGFGDISVFIFFGIIAVLGTYYLQSQNWQMVNILPAVTCGFFSMAVLNINNIRDIESDLQAGKFSIPVKVGRSKAVIYHAFLLFGGLTALLGFILINYESPFQFLPMFVTPLIIKNYLAVKNNKDSTALDPYLKQMALTTLLMVLLFGVSIILK